MRDREKIFADFRVDGQLFAQLAPNACGQRFAVVAFAARKFPAPFEVDAFLPSRHEKPSVALDDGGGHDDDHGSGAGAVRHAQPFAIGQTRHFGLRATHTVAPRSISAWLKS